MRARHTWITGVNRGPPDKYEFMNLELNRHGVRATMMSNDQHGVSSKAI